MTSTSREYDIAIVGAGLVGSALALSLQDSGYRIALLDQQTPPAAGAIAAEAEATWDHRIYAISPSSYAYLRDAGVWSRLDSKRIQALYDMQVYGEAGGQIHFSAYECRQDALAWTVENRHLHNMLWLSLSEKAHTVVHAPSRVDTLVSDEQGVELRLTDGSSLRTRLLVAADGAQSSLRGHCGFSTYSAPYAEQGLVANFSCEKPHRGTAFQWFRDDGVLAWLPLPGQKISIVWSTPNLHAQSLLALPEGEFSERVASAGAHRLGKLTLTSPVNAFALQRLKTSTSVKPRVVLVGDAAHVVHPLSGHGVNLGFADARVLAQQLTNLPHGTDPGSASVLRAYARQRAEEVTVIQSATHLLHQLFRKQGPWWSVLRNRGMNAVGAIPLLRRSLVRYASGHF